MNPTRLLGALALAAGGSLLLSELFVGQDVLIEITGTGLTHLRIISVIAAILGALAVGVGVREQQEFRPEGHRTPVVHWTEQQELQQQKVEGGTDR
jgi:hypothetical protein